MTKYQETMYMQGVSDEILYRAFCHDLKRSYVPVPQSLPLPTPHPNSIEEFCQFTQ